MNSREERNIEVEIRSFLSEEEYSRLIEFFSVNTELIDKDFQVTHYFDGGRDLRIQKGSSFSKIWLKKGAIHDPFREEIEIRLAVNDFEKAQRLLETLGFSVVIKWFRQRHCFRWQDTLVMLDSTLGYGHIIELEAMASESHKVDTLAALREKLRWLGIPETPKDEFDRRYSSYSRNWRQIVKEADIVKFRESFP